MNERAPESVEERKIRERLAFLSLPPAKAQRMISLGPMRDVTGYEQDLSYGLEAELPPDEMVGE